MTFWNGKGTGKCISREDRPLRILWINSAGSLHLTSRGKYKRIQAFATKHHVHLVAKNGLRTTADLNLLLREVRRMPEVLIPAYSLVRMLAAAVFGRQFDIVYTNPDISLLVGFLAKCILRIKIKWVIDLYDEPLPWDHGRKGSFRYFKYLIYRLLLVQFKALRHIDLGLAIGKDAEGGLPLILVKEYYIPRDRLVILPNGTDLNLFRPSATDTKSEHFTAIFVGEMKLDIGLYDLLKAFGYLRKKGFDARLFLVGIATRDELIALNQEIKTLGLAAAVTYLGEVPSNKLPEIYSKCDIGIYPFRKRRVLDCVFPLKVYEYLAMGLPVVATKLYGVSQIVHHGTNGLLVDPEDPSEMSSAIRRLSMDRELYGTLKRNTVLSVNANNWNDLVHRWMESVEGLK